MTIELADRVHRAIEIGRSLGRTAASPAVLAELGPRANGLADADPADAEVLVVIATEVDSRGAGAVDSPGSAGKRVAVLVDDGRLSESASAPNADGIVAVVFRRGVAFLDEGRFVLREVEEDVSAREAALELDVPLYTDERLVPFPR